MFHLNQEKGHITMMLNLQNGISGKLHKYESRYPFTLFWDLLLETGTPTFHEMCSGTCYSRQASLPFMKWSLHIRAWSPVTSSSCQHSPTSAVSFARKSVELGLSTLHKPLGAAVGIATCWHLQNLLINWFNICLYRPFCQPQGFSRLF